MHQKLHVTESRQTNLKLAAVGTSIKPTIVGPFRTVCLSTIVQPRHRDAPTPELVISTERLAQDTWVFCSQTKNQEGGECVCVSRRYTTCLPCSSLPWRKDTSERLILSQVLNIFFSHSIRCQKKKGPSHRPEAFTSS